MTLPFRRVDVRMHSLMSSFVPPTPQEFYDIGLLLSQEEERLRTRHVTPPAPLSRPPVEYAARIVTYIQYILLISLLSPEALSLFFVRAHDMQNLPVRPSNASLFAVLKENHWRRDVILDTPEFWNRIVINLPHSWTNTNLLGLVQMWLERSRSLPISLRLRTIVGDDSNPIPDFIVPYASWLQELFLESSLPEDETPIMWLEPLLRLPSGTTPHLECLALMTRPRGVRSIEGPSEQRDEVYTFLTSLPNFRRLGLSTGLRRFHQLTVGIPWSQLTHLDIDVTPAPPASFWHGLLRQCHQLVELTAWLTDEEFGTEALAYAWRSWYMNNMAIDGSDVYLPSLVTLRIKHLDGYDINIVDDFIQPLLIPSLKDLEVSLCHHTPVSWHPRTFEYVASRSHFTLERFSVPFGILEDLEEWLLPVPSLKELDISYGECLSESESEMLGDYEVIPHLEILKLRIAESLMPDTDRADTEALVRMIKARWRSVSEGEAESGRPRLLHVVIGIDDGGQALIEPYMESLRALKREGLKMVIFPNLEEERDRRVSKLYESGSVYRGGFPVAPV